MGLWILQRHTSILSPAQAAEAELHVSYGDAWLAAYGLFQDGYEDGWLTEQDLREALDFATRKMFSKLSGNVERKVSERLRELCLEPLVE